MVEEAIPTLEETIVAIKMKVVDELICATTLNANTAKQVTHKANQEYSKYRWRAVPTRDTGEFVVEGEARAA